jgi:hypothetical protein
MTWATWTIQAHIPMELNPAWLQGPFQPLKGTDLVGSELGHGHLWGYHSAKHP